MKRPAFLFICMFILAAYIVSALIKSSISNASAKNAYWPAKEWRPAVPEQQGMDSRILSEGIGYIQKTKVKMHSLLIIRNGYVVTDAYFKPYAKNSLHDLASISKSVMSVLTGIAVDKDLIKNADEKIKVFFPKYDMDQVKESIKIRDLLTMRTGLDLGPYATLKEYAMISSPDWEKFILADMEMSGKPGEKFRYNNMGPYLISSIIRTVSGMNASAFAKKYMFGPIGISDYYWPSDTTHGNTIGWGELRMKPVDLARIGYLMLNNGNWNGRQIVSKSWVAKSTSALVKLNEGDISAENTDFADSYGFFWWVNADSSYAAMGRNGQIMAIIPAKKLIVVMTGNDSSIIGIHNVEKTFISKYVIPSIKADGATVKSNSNYNKYISLLKHIDPTEYDSGNKDKASGAKPFVMLDATYMGKEYAIDGNFLNIIKISLNRNDKNDILIRADFKNIGMQGDKPITFRMAADGSPSYSEGRFGIGMISVLKQIGRDTLTFYVDEIGNIDIWNFTITFYGSGNIFLDVRDVLGQYRDTRMLGHCH